MPVSRKILLVDDSKLSLMSMRSLLEDYDFTILEASDGYEALDIIKNSKPALVFLDLLMPNLDGVGVLEKLKAEDISVPVVVVSADIQNTTRAICFKLGAIDFVNKPMEPEKVKSIIDKVFQE
ncbi:MAG: response regulator [Spirochaetales bacterium]|nr:response regulator [Spirochaetales bacterium]